MILNLQLLWCSVNVTNIHYLVFSMTNCRSHLLSDKTNFKILVLCFHIIIYQSRPTHFYICTSFDISLSLNLYVYLYLSLPLFIDLHHSPVVWRNKLIPFCCYKKSWNEAPKKERKNEKLYEISIDANKKQQINNRQ